ncbi:MAG: response regulator transcription factor [Acidobacteria bacterium]|nr:response regulator transcription factor [Acidobacteriota bacterium]
MIDDKIKVIITDDHTIFREGLSELLTQSGKVEVVGEASSGKEAVELSLKKKPDIIIMDVSMPTMSGLEATARIKDLMPEVRVLILSMYNNQQYIDKALANGASGYVMKDVAGSELLTAIEVIYSGGTYLSPSVSSAVLQMYKNSRNDKKKTESDLDTPLTQREIEVIKLLANGKTNKEIADTLYISIKTVETHRKNIMTKMDFHNLADIVRYAIKNKIISI